MRVLNELSIFRHAIDTVAVRDRSVWCQHAIDVEEFRAYTPEKFELLDGYLFDTRQHTESRRRLLHLLLVNVGLLEAVRVAPEERWREALQRVYET